ncbi:hypothetical protein M501DRAFT_1029587 [Patellaria atrata CBS 101060]|uniref:Uncharacterized protein n=1 Tax=Patellaria atrata CBS 101060 TaxID=1346257 RepID=A0A9P4SF35_9PEZI|nr:hypothetical protein M501DRAFT_1029587 [Patellaria atrata CBS 101060]
MVLPSSIGSSYSMYSRSKGNMQVWQQLVQYVRDIPPYPDFMMRRRRRKWGSVCLAGTMPLGPDVGDAGKLKDSWKHHVLVIGWGAWGPVAVVPLGQRLMQVDKFPLTNAIIQNRAQIAKQPMQQTERYDEMPDVTSYLDLDSYASFYIQKISAGRIIIWKCSLLLWDTVRIKDLERLRARHATRT